MEMCKFLVPSVLNLCWIHLAEMFQLVIGIGSGAFKALLKKKFALNVSSWKSAELIN